MEYKERCDSIINFIGANQGCLADTLVEGVKPYMSRTVVYKLIKELVREGIIEDKRLNRRDHRFFTNKNNPVYMLTQELDEFETALIAYVEYAKSKYDERIRFAIKEHNTKAFGDADRVKGCVQYPIIKFFTQVVNMYSTCAFLKWPSEIKDKVLLEKMYATLFERLNQIASRVSGLIEWAMETRMHRGEPIEEFKHEFDFHWMMIYMDFIGDADLATGEYERIMDIIWKISSYILPKYYSEMGWKEALERSRQTGIPI